MRITRPPVGLALAFELLLSCSAQAASRPDLHAVVAKIAAAAARTLPGGKAEVSGSIALISRDVRKAPNAEFSRAHGIIRGQGYIEVPTDTGMMFVVRLFPGGPKLHLPLAQALGEFDRRGARQHMLYLKVSSIGYAAATDVNVMIDVLFGRGTSDVQLRQTYAVIKNSLIRELGQ